MADDDLPARTCSVSAPLKPPLLEVGYNYTWPFNRYGTSIGPRDLGNDPPTGVNDATPVWATTLPRNLAILRDDLKITKVRMFLLSNAFNYGKRPIDPLDNGNFIFFAPTPAHPLFFSHFRTMLQIFKREGMQILPSLIDFGAFYPIGQAGGGRRSILTAQRQTFISTVLQPMLAVSNEPGLAETIFAWEVVNEPLWNVTGLPVRPHTSSTGPDTTVAIMKTFIQDCLNAIEGAGFQSTVGHRRLADLSVLPTGTMPQFHYYALDAAGTGLLGIDDPDPIPTFSQLAQSPRTVNAFVGEFSADKSGTDLLSNGPGRPWPECNQRDLTVLDASFERLKVLARKGYKLAFVWPDRSDNTPETKDNDEIKLTDDARSSIKRFTRGRFPGGIP